VNLILCCCSSVCSRRDNDERKSKCHLIPATPDTRGWPQMLARYRVPSPVRSIIELAITAGPFVLLWFLMWAALDLGYWLCLLLAVPAAGFLVRLFMIQHDCGHGAFFRHRLTNDWVGRVIGVLTLTPYDFWRRKHAIHHSTSGNLDRRGIGDIDTLTVHEYLARSRRDRLRYRIYRHPLVMFGLGPAPRHHPHRDRDTSHCSEIGSNCWTFVEAQLGRRGPAS
jgi:acyl-lipid omega-6 desaturase (Delta-12 desaturase)